MPPRKKTASADTDPLITKVVRSSPRLASQTIPAAANPDPTTNWATSSKPPSKVKTRAPPKPKYSSKNTQQNNKARSKRTKADTGDNEDDAPPSKKLKIATIDEEEEGAVDAGTEDDEKGDKKMVRSMSCQWYTPADLLSRSPYSSVAQLPLTLTLGWFVSVRLRLLYLRDIHVRATAATHQVYASDGEVWDATLNQTDLSKNVNKCVFLISS